MTPWQSRRTVSSETVLSSADGVNARIEACRFSTGDHAFHRVPVTPVAVHVASLMTGTGGATSCSAEPMVALHVARVDTRPERMSSLQCV